MNRIDMALNPPMTGEIRGVCPNPECGESTWFVLPQGARTTALFATVREVHPVVASCHWCHTRWVGEEQLELLNAAMNRDEAHRQAMSAQRCRPENDTGASRITFLISKSNMPTFCPHLNPSQGNMTDPKGPQ